MRAKPKHSPCFLLLGARGEAKSSMSLTQTKAKAGIV